MIKTFNNTELSLKRKQQVEAPQQSNTKRIEVSEQMAMFVDRLFIKLKAIFPAWKYSLETKNVSEDVLSETKLLWLQALVNNHITTAEQFKRGIECAEKSKRPYFPSVGEFINWCTDGNKYAYLGLPKAEDLHQRLLKFRPFYRSYEQDKFKFKSTAEYWLLTTIAYKSLQQGCNEAQELKLINHELDEMAKRLEAGEVLPEPVITLPEKPSFIPHDPELKANYFGNLKALWGTKNEF